MRRPVIGRSGSRLREDRADNRDMRLVTAKVLLSWAAGPIIHHSAMSRRSLPISVTRNSRFPGQNLITLIRICCSQLAIILLLHDTQKERKESGYLNTTAIIR